MWKEKVYMEHTNIIQSIDGTLALVGLGETLQIQIYSDGSDAYMDIDVEDATILIAKINEWIAAKTA
jgi:hypothetical protein